jgi:hypothetical protein
MHPHLSYYLATMSRIPVIRRLACLLAALGGAVLASTLAVPAAFAVPPPASGGTRSGTAPQPPVQVHTVVVGGMAGWQIALIAAGAALLAATAAVLLDRARAARRKPVTASA